MLEAPRSYKQGESKYPKCEEVVPPCDTLTQRSTQIYSALHTGLVIHPLRHIFPYLISICYCRVVITSKVTRNRCQYACVSADIDSSVLLLLSERCDQIVAAAALITAAAPLHKRHASRKEHERFHRDACGRSVKSSGSLLLMVKKILVSNSTNSLNQKSSAYPGFCY